MFRKIASIVVCVAMLAAFASGCNAEQKLSELIDKYGEGSATATSHDVAKAYKKYKPGDVMMTANGVEVTWGELFYLINYYIGYYEQNFGEISDWNAEMQDGMTYQEYILENATGWFKYAQAIESNTVELGIDSSGAEAYIQEQWDMSVENSGGEEAFAEQLEAEYCTPDTFKYIGKVSYLAEEIFNKNYGEYGANLSDEDVGEAVADDGYMMAKHILILKTKTNDDGETIDMEEDELNAAREKISGILDDLKNYEGDGFDAFFDEKMNEFSEDQNGLMLYPNGYLFQSGEMVEAFEDAHNSLEEGQFSDIVESDYGFHIVYRLPIDYDTVPYSYVSAIYSGYDYYTLRFIVANEIQNNAIENWIDAVTVTFTDKYEKMDFSKMF